MVLIREVNIAVRADFALTSGSTATIPRARFWFGQIMNQTLKAITKAIHIPKPIARNGACNVNA